MHSDARLMDVGAAMVHNEDTIVIVILAIAAASFLVLGWVDIGTWLDMRGTNDRTTLGPALRMKKLACGAVAMGLTVLYALTLVAEIGWYEPGIWPRMAVRVLTITAVICAAVTGVWFRRAYRREMERQAR